MPKTNKNIQKDTSSRSWFAVLNNPKGTFGDGLTPEEMIQKAVDIWIKGHEDDRSCGVNYEKSDSGTEHMHLVLEGNSKIRFSAVKKLFPKAHLEETRGSKKDAEDYIYKRGKYVEKSHTLIAGPIIHGEITAKPRGGAHGKTKGMKKAEIFEMAEIMIENGATPEEIFEKGGLEFRQYDNVIKKAYFAKRFKETPTWRDVKVYYHFGGSGSGKTRTYSKLCEKFGEEHVYLLNDYNNAFTSGGGFDGYGGEEILFMDEYKAQLPYATLLNILDGYRMQVHARYSNIYTLWNEVHITSIYPIEEIYDMTVDSAKQNQDTFDQLLRRVNYIIYHYIDGDKFLSYKISSKDYHGYGDMIVDLFNERPPENLILTEYGEILTKEELEKLPPEQYLEQIGFIELLDESDQNNG